MCEHRKIIKSYSLKNIPRSRTQVLSHIIFLSKNILKKKKTQKEKLTYSMNKL